MPINYANYNPAWPYLRELVSHRDRNRCKKCRAPHRVKIWRMKDRTWKRYEPGSRPANARALILCVCTVAHLDWNRNNDDPTNLALLCQQCHLDHDRPQHMYKRLTSKLRASRQSELFPATPPRPRAL